LAVGTSSKTGLSEDLLVNFAIFTENDLGFKGVDFFREIARDSVDDLFAPK